MSSKSQLKKQAQAAAAAAAKAEQEDHQMPAMPSMPDPRVKYLWSGDPAIRDFEFSKFVQIWPPYIDSSLTIEEGRRLGKEFCCDNPQVQEISEVCQSLRLKHVLEPYKLYPRLFGRPGRVRVEIFRPDGSPVNPEIKSKKELLKYIGTHIGLLNSRIARLAKLEELAAQQAAAEQKQIAAAAPAPTNNKKKHHKKK